MRQGYGEMYWIDGSIYKGLWVQGVQNGIGLMVFPDGNQKVGLFENNVYKSTINTWNDL